MMKKISNLRNKTLLLSIVALGFLIILTGIFYSSFALVEPVKSISFTSENLNYSEESGSWKIENSAEWIEKGQARVTITLDTIERTKNRNTDMIFVLDTSGSMAGEKLGQAKSDIKELFNSLLDIEGNKGALITFDQDSTILSDFTEDKDTLLNAVDGLYDRYTTNYYQALVNVNEILRNYQYQEDRDVVVVFMTDGVPNEDTPNEKNYFKYLKEAYPYITVNAVQYEMGSSILESVKDISDNQYIADIRTLKSVLFQASKVPVPYHEFEIESYIDTAYFSIESENDIKTDKGTVVFNKEEQKVIWNLDNLASGTSTTMTIDLKLKEEYVNSGGVYSTNINMNVHSRIENDIESVTNDKTPRLKNEYQVRYDGNLPNGCVVENIPGSKNYFTYDSVEVEDEISCSGYQFKGWKIVTENVNRPTKDYFIMPEFDVTLRGEWTNLSVAKLIDGVVNPYVEPVLQKIGANNYNEEIWKYKDSITKIIIQDQIRDIKEATETFDISEGKNYGVVGYIVPNTDDISVTTYTAYIQGDGKIKANENSSYLFYGFKVLESIEGLEYLDTSNVTNMRGMFDNCKKLLSLMLNGFDTSNVVDMSSMFHECNELVTLDMSTFDTSKVVNLSGMFSYCNKLKFLDLSNFNTSNVTSLSGIFTYCPTLENLNITTFDTSKVTSMFQMFWHCTNLANLDVSSFDTSSVKDMSYMFYNCSKLTSLDVSNFDTSKVTNMSNMFYNCSKLTSLNINHFVTSDVTKMVSMFGGCSGLKVLDLSNFNTSKVTTMENMFGGCRNLTSLDISNFDTSNVTIMGDMFNTCSGLANLDVSHFDTSKVTSMEAMFQGCGALTSLDVSSFDTSNVTNMTNLFYCCGKLESLNVSSFNTISATSMYRMFYGCYKLIKLDLSNFDTSKVSTMYQMFGNCYALIEVNLSSFDTFNVYTMESMFINCNSLISLDLSSFNTSNLRNVISMFSSCNSLININLSSFDTSQIIDFRNMFNGCTNLTTLDLSNFDTSNVTDMRYMFLNCSSLSDLIIDNFDTSNVINMESMFSGCTNLKATISILNKNLTGYSSVFNNTATSESALVTVNYISDTSDLVDLMIATKSTNSNVEKGIQLEAHNVIIAESTNVEPDLSLVYVNQVVTLVPKLENYQVISFKLNGILLKGDSFSMPNEDVTITDITLGEMAIFETSHSPYSALLEEKTFEGATSLTVILEVETRNPSGIAGLYLTDSSGTVYGKFAEGRKIQTITIPGNYIKVDFRADNVWKFYYGALVKVYANYD